MLVFISSALLLIIASVNAQGPKVTDKVYFDVKIGDGDVERIENWFIWSHCTKNS